MNARAKQIIEDIVREAKVGEYYLATVKRIEKFGAFCEIFPGKMACFTFLKFKRNVRSKWRTS